jgi:cell division septum initiation protein DivIVA
MGRRADKKKSKAEEFSDSAVAGVRKTAHAAVDSAEEFFGKSKRKTKKARKQVDEVANKAEKKLARVTRKAERKAARIRDKAKNQVDKVTGDLPDDE